VLARGLCGTCYTLKRQDEEHFGDLREQSWSWMATAAGYATLRAGANYPSSCHHRVPGRSVLKLKLSLCSACHTKVHRTKAVLLAKLPLLLEAWREQTTRS
jgi:hypothetical protein